MVCFPDNSSTTTRQSCRVINLSFKYHQRHLAKSILPHLRLIHCPLDQIAPNSSRIIVDVAISCLIICDHLLINCLSRAQPMFCSSPPRMIIVHLTFFTLFYVLVLFLFFYRINFLISINWTQLQHWRVLYSGWRSDNGDKRSWCSVFRTLWY